MFGMKFYQLPQGRKFQFREGKRLLSAVKVADTEVVSTIGVQQYVGNAVLLEENGLPAKDAGEILLLQENQDIDQI